MLATKLSRAQLELQSHRIWLRTFSLGRNATVSFTTTAQRHAARPAKTSSGTHWRRPRPLVQKYRTQKKLELTSDNDDVLVTLQRRLSEASKEKDFDAAMEAYRAIENKQLIIAPVVISLTSNMAFWARVEAQLDETRKNQELAEKLAPFAEELVRDITRNALGPCPTASAHLLHYFVATRSWDIATRLWKWLEAQEDQYVSADVYSAAISLQAAQDASLEDLEVLYEQGLARLPVGFAAYHFSPGAIVPDRERNVPVFGLPLELLAGIMSARLMRGDTQNAYLALDSALRLRPMGQFDNIFFTEYQRERPVSEAYTVFAIACKAGRILPPSAYRGLLPSLRNNADTSDARRFVLTVRAMLSATFLQLGAGGKLARNAVTEIIIVLCNLARIEGVKAMPHEDKMQFSDAVQELIRKMTEVAARFSAVPTIAAYNTMITDIAGLGDAEKTITAAMQNVQDFGLVSTPVTRRSILVAAGSARNAELVRKAWGWLVKSRSKEGQLPDTTDLHILTKSCVQAGNWGFAQEVIGDMSHIEEWQRENLLERLEKKTDLPDKSGKTADVQALLAEIAKIKADLEVFEERTSDANGTQDFSTQHVPMLLFSPPKDVRLPEAEMRKLYDQLTTDSKAPKDQEPASFGFQKPQGELEGNNDVTRDTNVPFGQLRYEDWKLITYLLAEAERHNQAYVNAVDAAIAKGERPSQRNYGELFEGEEKIEGVGLSDLPQELVKDCEEVDVEKVRARICELRKVEVPKN